MTTAELMKKYKKSEYTVKIWRRGYYIKSYRGKASIVWLLPDHSKIPCEWVREKETGRMYWEYNPTKVDQWIRKLAAYRKYRVGNRIGDPVRGGNG
jgi:hypothetical protein